MAIHFPARSDLQILEAKADDPFRAPIAVVHDVLSRALKADMPRAVTLEIAHLTYAREKP